MNNTHSFFVCTLSLILGATLVMPFSTHAAIYARADALNAEHTEGLLTITFPISASTDVYLPLTIVQVLGPHPEAQYTRFKEGKSRHNDTVRSVLLLSNSAVLENGRYRVTAGIPSTFTIVSVLSTDEPLSGAYFIPIQKPRISASGTETEYVTFSEMTLPTHSFR